MAVVTVKSTFLTNRDAIPKVLTDPFISGGQLSSAYGFCTATSADSVLSAYKLVSIPSNARLDSVRYSNTALGGTSVFDIAYWYPTVLPQGGANFLAASLAGTLIASTAIATSLVVATANVAWVDVITNATITLATQEMPLWQVLGLSTDPELNFDLGFIVRTAAITSTGTVGLKVAYIY